MTAAYLLELFTYVAAPGLALCPLAYWLAGDGQ